MMSGWYTGVILLFFVTTCRSGPVQESNQLDDGDDLDCALDAAPQCFQPLMEIFNCSSLFTSCDDPLLTPDKMDSFCSVASQVINECLVDILETSCSSSDPKHSYYNQWRKPLNSVLSKVCAVDSIITITQSIGCQDESIFTCLFSTIQTDWVEMLTTKIPPEICGHIEFKGQYCLTTSAFPIQCKSLMKLIKDVTQEFLDGTECSNQQPVILVPLEGTSERKPTSAPPVPDGGLESSDRACARDPFIISSCFEPMLGEWRCYFSSTTTGCGFNLETLCSYASEAFESCVTDLLGYGCKNDSEHHFFYQWLSMFRDLHVQLCGDPSSYTPIAELEQNYFIGKVPCWLEFFTCLHSLQNEKQFINLITEKITEDTCKDLADKIDYCLIFPGPSDKSCDAVTDKIQSMKNTFTNASLCNDLQLKITSNATNTKIRFLVIIFIYFALFLVAFKIL